MDEQKQIMQEEGQLSAWEKMYRDAEMVKSNMKFYSSEMAFLRSLMDRYLLWLVEEESMTGLQILISKIKKTDEKCSEFSGKAESLMNRLGQLIENPFTQDEHKIMDSFKHTFEEVNAFEIEIKRVKQEIFEHIAHTLRTEKGRHLLNAHPKETAK